MTFDDSSSTKTSTSWRSEALLTALLALGSIAVYFNRPEIADERRFILALAAAGFIFAPLSNRPLNLLVWFPLVAIVSWGGQFAAVGRGDFFLWLVSSIVGAALAIRAGGRAATYYLPEAGTDSGRVMQRVIRGNLHVSFVLFAGVFVWDGYDAPSPYLRGVILLLSAIWFLRYLLLQSKYLHLSAKPLHISGLVPAQRWPFLVILLMVGATRLPERLLSSGDDGPLLLTSLLLLVLAGLVAVMSLVRLGWPRSLVRKTSFIVGMGLAVTLAAVVVEIEGWGPARFTSFTTFCSFVLLVVPFANGATKLFHAYPRASELIGAPVLSVMMVPLAAINGWRWELTSTGFLFAFAVVMLVYHFVVATREGFGGRLYIAGSLLVLGIIFLADGTAWADSGAAWKVFLIALGFALYAVDLRDRARSLAKLVPA